MFTIIFSEKFEKSFSKLKSQKIKVQIWNKIIELEKRAPIITIFLLTTNLCTSLIYIKTHT